MHDVKLDFDDILLVPQFTDVTSRKQVTLTTEIHGRWGQTLRGVPIIAANMHGVGTFTMASALSRHGLFTAITKDVSVGSWLDFFDDVLNHEEEGLVEDGEIKHFHSPIDSVFLTIGMDTDRDDNMRKLKLLVAAKCFPKMKIVIDVANGYMNPFYDYIQKVRETAPDAFIMAGTVCTPEAALRIVESGADLARVGIGTGAVCTTRKVAGVGYPQASAIAECSQVADVVGDGGCTDPADFAKAFALGASMVMAGTVFAGHEEGGKAPDADGKVHFYGMSSLEAQKNHANITSTTYRSSEGREVKIPYRGSVHGTVEHILGGLRSACAYSNAKFLGDLHKEAQVIQVNRQLNRTVERYTI